MNAAAESGTGWDTEPYRLIGLSAFDLVGDRPQQLELFDGSGDAEAHRLESTLDAIRQRFGKGAVGRAEDLDRPGGQGTSVNLDHLRPG